MELILKELMVLRGACVRLLGSFTFLLLAFMMTPLPARGRSARRGLASRGPAGGRRRGPGGAGGGAGGGAPPLRPPPPPGAAGPGGPAGGPPFPPAGGGGSS